ncbi:MAG TPA: DUF748 domain-containing protein [Steroidobacteraceae bacterium]|nr:DUF748 domain-containing protein [Steroidobacteraceae bacterium]
MPVSLESRAARRIFLWTGVALLVVAAYGLFGFYGVPALIRSQGTAFVMQKYQRTLQLGDIHFNPFTLELDLRDFAFPDSDGKPMLGAHRLYVNLQLASIWNRGATFKDIQLEAPAIHAQLRTDGSLNLADLAKPFANQPSTPPAAPARIFLGRLAVIGGEFTFIDLGHPTTLHAELRPVNFELRDFNTIGNGANGYTLAAATLAGETFHWSGTLEVSPVASKGRFDVKALRVTTLTGFAGPAVPLTVSSGVITLDGGYDFALHDGVAGLQIDLQTLALDNLALRPHAGQSDYVVLPRIEINGTHVDLAERSVLVDAVKVAGGQIHGWLNDNGTLNLVQLAGSSGAGTPASAAPVTAPATASAPTAPTWSVKVPKIDLAGLAVDFEDHSLTPAPRFTLAPLDISVGQFQWPFGPPLAIQVKASLNQSATLNANAQVTLPDATAKAHVELTGFELPVLQPYVARYTGLALLSGRLGFKGDIERSDKGALTVTAETDVARFRTVDDELQMDFIKWDRLNVAGIKYQSSPAALSIRSIRAQAPYARVIIDQNRNINITEALKPAGSVTAAPAPAPAAPPPVAKSSSTTRTVHLAPASHATTMPLSIGTVQITNGSANYADQWIQPHFAIGIQQLNGTIDGLSSDPNSRAKIDLNGSVDRYAPAHIWGETNLLSQATYTDISMSYRGIELTGVTPYSGHFAGYKIAKGKLTVDLKYHIENRQLTASHHIVVDQLQLGDKVDSPDAVNLPLKLAVSLLKDRNGVIDLDLPVTGSLDDPQFKIGPIIWKVFVNLIEKAVTAPFKLLGSLFGGGDQVNVVEFAPGSAALDATAQTRLASITKALDARPGLELDIPDTYSTQTDSPALATHELENMLRKRAGIAADAPPADPATQFKLLLAQYREELGSKAPLPPATQELTTAKKSKDATPDYAAANAELTTALLQRIKIDDTQLQALGTRRAHAVQDVLLHDTDIDPARIFLINTTTQPPPGNTVRLELALK